MKNRDSEADGEKKLYRLRRRVNELFFEMKKSKNSICKRLGVSKEFVIRWTRSTDQGFDEDKRGWKKGKWRKWTEENRERILKIHLSLRSSREEFFWGASAIAHQWRERYPADPVPPLRTIGRILSESGLSQKRRGKIAGAAKYLCYPEYTIYDGLGYRVLEADFIGRKFLTGDSKPINFIGFSFKKEPRMRYFQRVAGETAESFIGASQHFFEKFEVPDAMKVDNGPATVGGSGKRNLSRVMSFLLEKQIIPIFAVPRRPFSQASIEGNNSVFSRKFWNREKFSSLQEIDQRLAVFNEASRRYTGYQFPIEVKRTRKNFIPKVFFIRQVQNIPESTNVAYISVLNENISLPENFVNYFVLAEWNLSEEKLSIFFEKEKQSELIRKIDFPICFSRNRGSAVRAKRIKTL